METVRSDVERLLAGLDIVKEEITTFIKTYERDTRTERKPAFLTSGFIDPKIVGLSLYE